MSDNQADGVSRETEPSEEVPDRLMPVVLVSRELDGGPWYVGYTYRRDSLDPSKDHIIGFGVRPRYETVGGSEDLDEFMEKVEEVCLHVEWFPRAITEEVLRSNA